MHREIELKGVVDDLAACRARVEDAGAKLVFEGRLEDRRYDTPDRSLAARDLVLRLRVTRTDGISDARIDWKGPTNVVDGFKVRDELSTTVGDSVTLARILSQLGYVVTREVDREILQYDLCGTQIRFEAYPRMDTLVEVEGNPEGIEAAIAATGLPRSVFTSGRLPEFVKAYETRTGIRAAISDRERDGEYRFR